MASITFLGAAGTVTGSRFLVETARARVLLDCGLFQGLKELRLLNWDSPGFDPRSLDAVALSHAHLDHSGYLPRLVVQGFSSPVYATEPTIDLCGILLPDSGYLQEEQAEHANRYGYSKHDPALPLYTEEDARRTLGHLRPSPYGEITEIARGVRIRMLDAGHILGSAIIEVWVEDDGKETKIVFSGDLGRYEEEQLAEELLSDPTGVKKTDILLVESTYGSRLHSNGSPEEQLAKAVRTAAKKKGALVIPAFAVGRTQQLLYALHNLLEEDRIPDLPVYVDSPMAIDATEIFLAHPDAHRVDLHRLESNGENPLHLPRLSFVRSAEDSMKLDEIGGPMILISASGMATGGRILRHLETFLPDPRATILFVGYQAAGTRGRSLLDGAKELKMRGKMVPLKAEVRQIDGFSAHADRDEILRWLRGFEEAPTTTFLVHGEDRSAEGLRDAIGASLGWKARIPSVGDTFRW